MSSERSTRRIFNGSEANWTAACRSHCKKMIIPWQKPLGGTIKVNWDAPVDGRRMRIRMGTIVRDSEGSIIAMMCDTVDCIQDPATTKALAARSAVELSLSLGIQRIILEGDLLQVVHAL